MEILQVSNKRRWTHEANKIILDAFLNIQVLGSFPEIVSLTSIIQSRIGSLIKFLNQ